MAIIYLFVTISMLVKKPVDELMEFNSLGFYPSIYVVAKAFKPH